MVPAQKTALNRVQSSLPACKTPLLKTEKAGSWNYKITSLLLHSLSVIASYLVPFSFCAVILPCTDADQMEDWKMKGATDEKEEGKKKDWERKANKSDHLQEMVFLHSWSKTETS